jgi:glucose-1-phosphate thymidylyltransferase
VKGLILAGGSGTRMRPFTYSIAKQLLPIVNEPILHRAIKNFVAAGIKEIGIVIGATGAQVRQSVGDGSDWGANVVYIPQVEPLGLAHCVKISRDFLGSEDFIMFLGDNMFENDFSTFLDDISENMAKKSLVAQVAVKPVDNPSAFGVAVVDAAGNLHRVDEKPLYPTSDLALVGTYFFTPIIHDVIQNLAPSARGELEITDAIQVLLEKELCVAVSHVNGWWHDTGNPSSFLECNRDVLQIEAPTSYSYNSSSVEIVPPCVIDASAELSDCIIGPYVTLGPKTQVNGVAITNSVVFEGTTISGSGHLTESIIGRNCSVTISNMNRSKVVIGDDTYLEI